MKKDLTNSGFDRQNILNNQFAVVELQKAVSIKGVLFENVYRFTKEQIARFYEVDIRTIERYLEAHKEEIANNGYEVLRGKRLKELKMQILSNAVTDIDVGKNTPLLGLFDFRSFLNIGMLLTESKRAELLRATILDIVIDVINQRTGGGTKYINQRDEDFVYAWFQEEDYRKQFTDSLRDYVDMGNFKYPMFTNKIYVSIFKEEAMEYKKILNLNKEDKIRDTFYSEILDLIASYEAGFADVLKQKSTELGRKLNNWEVDKLFSEFESLAHWKPLVERARQKMASQDLAFRDALHNNLKEYIMPLKASEFERFLGDKSMELAQRLENSKDVYKRLKERE